MLLRPVQHSDLDALFAIAQKSDAMVSTLPADRELLSRKIERSIHSFTQSVFCPGEEYYLFVLEDVASGRLLGTGAINALAGYRQPFYAFRNDTLIHSSRQLSVHSRIHALTLNHDLSDHSQLCSFYAEHEIITSALPSLISMGRLLFMAAHPMRFSSEWMAVLPGIAENDGRAPFWEHVGRKFFGVDYPQVEHYLSTRDSTFIAELMPHHPLYVPLIDEEAQAVMGQIHPNAEVQCNLLTEQGFEPDKYIAMFDSGPILTAPRNALSIWQQAQSITLAVKMNLKTSQSYLIGIDNQQGFNACFITGKLENGQLLVSAETAKQMQLRPGQTLWCASH